MKAEKTLESEGGRIVSETVTEPGGTLVVVDWFIEDKTLTFVSLTLALRTTQKNKIITKLFLVLRSIVLK